VILEHLMMVGAVKSTHAGISGGTLTIKGSVIVTRSRSKPLDIRLASKLVELRLSGHVIRGCKCGRIYTVWQKAEVDIVWHTCKRCAKKHWHNSAQAARGAIDWKYLREYMARGEFV
jgi:hypothetical protein